MNSGESIKLTSMTLAAFFAIAFIANQITGNSPLMAKVISPAGAAQGEPSEPGGMANQGAAKGGQGQQGESSRKGMSKVLEADDSDSDRPVWAGGNKELNPHRGDPNPNPGVNKGEDYGDLWVVVRNPVTGAPILVDGEYQVCLDAQCTQTVLTVDGELPEGIIAAEVELGRANIVRSPDSVTLKALDEVLTKLSVASSVTTDASGRLVIDGATVDSPLENLGLYIAIMTSDPKLTSDILAKLPNDLLSVAASALAAGADKTGTITLDFLVYLNVIMGVTTNDTFYNYGDYDYSRDTTYSGNITYFVQQSDGTVISVTEPMMDAIFDGVSYTSNDGSGASDFTQAADDALQVIEFIHTQIHTE